MVDRHPDVSLLIYATPLEVGADGDAVKRAVRQDFHLYLDIVDQHYFVEREERSAATRGAADSFSHAIVDPLLADAGVISRSSQRLSSHESRAALLYLVLQREDDDLDRHLTKLCFDALVKAVLRDTHNANRMPRSDVRARVRALLPTHPVQDVNDYVDRALDRLSRRAIRHWRHEDEYCLSYEARTAQTEGLSRLALLNDELENELHENLDFVAEGMMVDVSVVDTAAIITRLRRVMERFLFERGEAFVESLRTGQELLFVAEELTQLAVDDVSRHADTSSLRQNMPTLVSETVERTLRVPSPRVQQYLRAIADGYTLFAFLRETPNVQSAVTKLFSHGEIWLDTTAALPVLAEDLLDEDLRGYGRLLGAAKDAGVRLFVTPGVLEEINSHIDVSLRAARSPDTWNRRTPFLFAAYIWSGQEVAAFPQWLERFRGAQRPLDDLAEYLRDEHGIAVVDLSSYASAFPDDVRWHCEEYWREVHEQRRKGEEALSSDLITQLARHDVENFLGVLGRRTGEEIGNPFGYSTWWLTLDRWAGRAAREISSRITGSALDSPVLSFDFLTYYLAVGPARRALEKSREQRLPLAVDQSLLDAIPKDLLAAAEAAREDVVGQDDRVVRRRIRDHLDREKLRQGRVGKAGIEAIREDFRLVLSNQARER